MMRYYFLWLGGAGENCLIYSNEEEDEGFTSSAWCLNSLAKSFWSRNFNEGGQLDCSNFGITGSLPPPNPNLNSS